MVKKGPFFFGFVLMLKVFFLDVVTKLFVAVQLSEESFVKVTSFLNFDIVGNEGISFGLLQGVGGHSLFIGGILVFLGFLFFQLWRTKSYLLGVSLGCILGGALGNLLDRIRFGAVVDFIDVHFWGWHWWTFNIADVAITIGVLLYILDEFIKKKEV